jgi:hypothetical protein
MSNFKIQCSWLPARGSTEIDATMSRLKIKLGDRVVSEYEGEHVSPSEFLESPAYYLAEWIAENWWPLLWEPRKSEDAGDTPDFLARHSTLTAQHGFALPNLVVVPQGRAIEIAARARTVQFADVRFIHSANVRIVRAEVEEELKAFVSSVAARLSESAIHDTDLQDEWEMITQTAEDEAQFCRFMGALGLSPYVPHEKIESTLERLLMAAGERVVMDLCLASGPDNFEGISRITEHAVAATDASNQVATLEPLTAIPVPGENFSIPAWRRGVQAAKRVRTKLRISETDPAGAEKFFAMLNLDPSSRTTFEVEPEAIIVGAVRRDDLSAKVALLQRSETQRRFAGARAGFAAWTSERPQASRLLTLAVTRDQQASRAFAAEMTAPVSYIRARATRSKLSQDQVFELANELNIGPDVVRYQAENNGLTVGRF